MDEIKKSWVRHYEPEEGSKFQKPSQELFPDKNSRRQNHIGSLLWHAQFHSSELEAKRLESKRTRRESRAKYGW